MPDPARIHVHGKEIEVSEGSTVAAAVMAAGETRFRRSVTGEPRGPLCGMGICFECRLTINGQPHVRSCQGMPFSVSSPAPGTHSFDIVVVGAGPAGIAAACAAAESGAKVAVIDDNPAAGGQIWRGGARKAGSTLARQWFTRFAASGAALLAGTTVIGRAGAGALLAVRDDAPLQLRHSRLILATGARERFLPFPGWTLPNVVGAGGLEALVRGGLPIKGRRVVIAGSGPMLLAVAAELRQHGAVVPVIAEQAAQSAITSFGLSLVRKPRKFVHAAKLRWRLGDARYATGTWPVSAEGANKLEAVVLRCGESAWREPCDYLACGFGLVPNIELAALFDCSLADGFVVVNQWQQTSVDNLYCAGEPVAIGGVDLAIATGCIAGYHAAGNDSAARQWYRARANATAFAKSLERTFALRDELKSITAGDTLVCRCEDVPFSQLRAQATWRSAKLQTRCGMGPCQGRVCGPAVEFLLGWRAESVRPPVFPARVRDLAAL